MDWRERDEKPRVEKHQPVDSWVLSGIKIRSLSVSSDEIWKNKKDILTYKLLLSK